jgi:RNA polymerase primary sigma factor
MRQISKDQPKLTDIKSEPGLAAYLSEIGKIGLLTADQEVSLAQRIRCGDKAALDAMVSANLRFVVTVAKQYKRNGLGCSQIELIQAGNLGLIEAAKRFDETKGFKFISYAVWWIRQSIIKHILDNKNLVYIPQHVGRNYEVLAEAERLLHLLNEAEPTVEQLIEATGIDELSIRRSHAARRGHVELDATVNDENDTIRMDFLACTERLPDDIDDTKEVSKNILMYIRPKYRSIVCMRFGINTGREAMTLNEIAQSEGVTVERVRQIINKALEGAKKKYDENQKKRSLRGSK